MKHDLTTGTWQDDTGCPISIVLAATSDVGREGPTAGNGLVERGAEVAVAGKEIGYIRQ